MKNGFIKPFLLTVTASRSAFEDLAKTSWISEFFGLFLLGLELLLTVKILAERYEDFPRLVKATSILAVWARRKYTASPAAPDPTSPRPSSKRILKDPDSSTRTRTIIPVGVEFSRLVLSPATEAGLGLIPSLTKRQPRLVEQGGDKTVTIRYKPA